MALTLTVDPIFIPASDDPSFQDVFQRVMNDLIFRIHQDLRNILVANQGGQVTLASGTKAVTFDTELSNTNYYITFGPDTTGETLKWSSKTTTGFTITSSSGSSTIKVDWHIHQKLE